MDNAKLIRIETYVDGELELMDIKFDMSIYDKDVVRAFMNEIIDWNSDHGKSLYRIIVTDEAVPGWKRIDIYFKTCPAE